MKAPVVERHGNIFVVRDDLLPGGSKYRYTRGLLRRQRRVVYAGPPHGAAQVALATAARESGGECHLFVPRRKERHCRTQLAEALGAVIHEVYPGYLSNLTCQARAFAFNHDACLVDLGAPLALDVLVNVAQDVDRRYGPFDEVWCAAGSGTLLRALRRGIKARYYTAVQVGKSLGPDIFSLITNVVVFPRPFSWPHSLNRVPFPTCPYYEAKAWSILHGRKPEGKVLFWNVYADSAA